MAKLLVFNFFPAYLPPRSGGELRLFALYEALSSHHEITLLTSGELGGCLQTLRHNCRFTEVRVPKDGYFAEAWANLAPHAGSGDLSGPCLAASATQPSPLLDAYLRYHKQADIIVHDFPFTVDYDLFIGFDGKPRVYNSHNVEFDLYGAIHADAPTDEIVEIVRRCEGKLVSNAQLVSACSEADLARFADLYGPPAATALSPNGMYPFVMPNIGRDSNRLIFIGSAHHPNQVAAAIIRDELAPKFPNYEFHLIGLCHEAGQCAANVIAHGMVDDDVKVNLFKDALACVNPMVDGGGSSLKIPEMASYGVPLISTELGVRGYGLVPGEHYSQLDPVDMCASLKHALSNKRHLVKQAKAAANTFASHFTWPEIALNLSAALDKLLDGRGPESGQQRVIVLNDYDPFATVGGGATRIRGLYQGASSEIQPIFLSFSEGTDIVRREVLGGRGLSVAVPKTDEHREKDAAQAAEFYVSTADLVAMEMAPSNSLLMSIFEATRSFANLVACEHPYMATMLFSDERKFVYSSQNCEAALKRQLLAYHPRRDDLIASVEMIERFCVACSELIVAVAESDAALFAADHDLLAPLVVIRNGAEDPILPEIQGHFMPGFNVCFLGSSHVPNYQAVRFLLDEVAPLLPNVTFHIAGSVCNGVEPASGNVICHGPLDDGARTHLLLSCQLALNPMSEGSGSNVKVADYLMHGLRVLSTPFGARGYEEVGESDLLIVPLSDFSAALSRLANQEYSSNDRENRQQRFMGRLSMSAFGSAYGGMLASIPQRRRRALFVTYRYNDPPRGGGEFYVNRLVAYLADSGIDVDVLTAKVDNIVDDGRFASTFPLVPSAYPVPYGNPRIRVAKFDVEEVPGRQERLERCWAAQADYERALFAQYTFEAHDAGLLWGWCDFDGSGRWTMDRFAIRGASSGTWHLTGQVPGSKYLVLRNDKGVHLLETYLEGYFDLTFEANTGLIQGYVFDTGAERPDDPRPLGVYLTSVQHNAQQMLANPILGPWKNTKNTQNLFLSLHQAAKKSRFPIKASLAENRGPYAPSLEAYLEAQGSNYDIIITHNSVFRTCAQAVRVANKFKVPSVVIPHAHFEDDYYHFEDVMASIKNATRSLVTPSAAVKFLNSLGFENVDYLSPGIDGHEVFSDQDEEDFYEIYQNRDPFILVAGRKASAKGYEQVISSVKKLRESTWPNLRIVMIGPDDDGRALTDDFVTYLGMVDRAILRGAFRASQMLVNMSTSESFGMVILEAGLAAKPVVVNAECAAFVELVEDRRNGLLATPSDLADRISEVLSDRSLADEMGKNGRAVAMSYDWDQIGAKFVAHCNQLMALEKA